MSTTTSETACRYCDRDLHRDCDGPGCACGCRVLLAMIANRVGGEVRDYDRDPFPLG